jgi:hypothetical protein
MRKLILFSAICISCIPAFGYFEQSDPGRKPREMNGIYFDKQKDFTKNWHLVTVRYRQDSGEQRFVYANDLAFKALSKLKPDFPDGAMFAKAAFMTEDDPSFTSSKVPSVTKRFQFMLKGKKKYANSNGWGYALFDDQGNLFNEDMKAKTQACIACHQIVPERDYVFSRPMFQPYNSISKLTSGEGSSKIVKFEIQRAKQAPAALSSLILAFDIYNSLVGPLRDTAFSGTLDEVIPLLSEKSKKSEAPSALIVNADNFSLVIPNAASKKCIEQNSLLKAYRIVVQSNAKLIRDTEVCL